MEHLKYIRAHELETIRPSCNILYLYAGDTQVESRTGYRLSNCGILPDQATTVSY